MGPEPDFTRRIPVLKIETWVPVLFSPSLHADSKGALPRAGRAEETSGHLWLQVV